MIFHARNALIIIFMLWLTNNIISRYHIKKIYLIVNKPHKNNQIDNLKKTLTDTLVSDRIMHA